MDSPLHQGSSVLFQNEAKTVICLDIPRTIEESQALPGKTTDRRIFSTEPISTPFPTPEPRDAAAQAQAQSGSTPAAQLADLMTGALVESALGELKTSYSGPFCLPRIEKKGSSVEEADENSACYVPEDARYLCGAIEASREEFMKTAPMFNLVVLDPPWPNRSAKRKKRKRGGYETCYGFDETRELLSLIPVQKHLAPGGVVAIWVTNSPSVNELLTSRGGILSDWGLELVGEWIWLKITSSGDPIVAIESTWRKPWERLLIAKRRGDLDVAIISNRVLIGVPDMHSRKPNLRGLFEDVLGPRYAGLEVFARHLTAGWWSWGDEVTKFQEEKNWNVARP